MNKIIIPIRYGEEKDEVIQWVFANTKGRFCYDGVPDKRLRGAMIMHHDLAWSWYFEDESEAVFFKLRWGEK
jgi:hypothetical protein